LNNNPQLCSLLFLAFMLYFLIYFNSHKRSFLAFLLSCFPGGPPFGG
jgi:hypothetical protein